MVTVFGVLLIVSTGYDMIVRRAKGMEPHKLLIAFSVYTNGRKLVKVHRDTPSKSIDCLEGLRCISLICIIFSHRCMLQLMTKSTNIAEVYGLLEHYWSVAFLWPTYCVDTFLVIAGFLSSLQLLHVFEKKKFNVLLMIAHRYIRYTPVLAASILIFTSLARHVKAPYPDAEGSEDCYKYWWSALLHFQNYINPENICPSHAWYLSVDFQLFIISPLLIYPARKYGWKYCCGLLALAVLSAIGLMTICLVHNLEVLEDFGKKNALIKVPTHALLPPWLIGMVLGYVIFESRTRQIKMKKELVLILWTLSLAALAVNVALQYPIHHTKDNQVTVMEHAVIIGFGHLIWSFPIAWIIFACYKLESGGIIRSMLSLREWQPIGRMSLSIYVTHFFYQRLTLMNEHVPMTVEVLPVVRLLKIYFQDIEISIFHFCFQFIKYLGDLLASLVLGAVFSLTLETPFVLIERYIYNRPEQKILEREQKKKAVMEI